MKLQFTKMHGCGNDYVYVDCFSQTIDDPAALAVRLSARHTGIGADGMILICPSEVAHARMRMFNADGSEGKMCGNGVRCVAEYLYTHGRADGQSVEIETLSGVKHIVRKGPGLYTVDMGAPILEPAQVPLAPGFTQPVINGLVEIGGGAQRVTCLSMGNPHCVVFTQQDVNSLDLPRQGPRFEHDNMFPESVNTEFVRVRDPYHLEMRVWERGSGETLACGTGACASVAAAVLCGHCAPNTDVEVRLLGGKLTIRRTADTVFMTGDAVTVFDGSVDV